MNDIRGVCGPSGGENSLTDYFDGMKGIIVKVKCQKSVLLKGINVIWCG